MWSFLYVIDKELG